MQFFFQCIICPRGRVRLVKNRNGIPVYSCIQCIFFLRKLGVLAVKMLEEYPRGRFRCTRSRVFRNFVDLRGLTKNEAERQLRERVIYRKICLFIQSETGRRFIETIFSVIATKSMGIATKKYKGVNPLHYIKSCIESFRLNRSAPQLIPACCGPIPVAY